MIDISQKPLLGKKGLVLGIANEHSIAYGCAEAFRALGAELAITYLNDQAKSYVGPFARALEAPIFLRCNVGRGRPARGCVPGHRENLGEARFRPSRDSICSTARDVMSKPVITVGEDTETGEIARLLQAYRIKRVPVVRDGKMVGIVSRENLLRALAEQEAPHGAKPEKPLLAGVFAELDRHFNRPHRESESRVAPTAPQPDDTRLTVGDFHRLAADYESKELQHREAQRRSAAEERRRRVTELIDQHLSDEGWRNLVHQTRMTAERGGKEFMLLRFPSQLCSDGGGAINVAEPDWPATLRDEAAELYLRWARDLKPQGFHLTARVLDFPGGVPGEVGIFLGWRQ